MKQNRYKNCEQINCTGRLNARVIDRTKFPKEYKCTFDVAVKRTIECVQWRTPAPKLQLLRSMPLFNYIPIY